MEYLKETDALIMEYLLFRGFTETYHEYVKEQNSDRLKGLCSDKVVEQLFSDLSESNIDEFLSLWEFIEERFFKVLTENKLIQTAEKLKNHLLRFYLLNAFKCKRREKVTEFFEKYIQKQCDINTYNWREWYSLPYYDITEAESDPVFGSFFDPEWRSALKLSVCNFIEQVFREIPSPRLLGFNLHSRKMQAMKSKLNASNIEIESYQKEIETLNLKLANQLRKLEQQNLSDNGTTKELKEVEKSLKTQVTDIGKPLPENENQLPENVSKIGTHNGYVNACRISPDGETVATGSNDATVKLWQVNVSKSPDDKNDDMSSEQGDIEERKKYTIYCESAVLSLDWHESSSFLALGTSTSEVKIWDCKARTTAQSILTSDPRLPHVVDLKFCPRSHLLVTANALIKNNNQIHEYLNPFGRGDKGVLQFWNWSTGQMQQKLKIDANPDNQVSITSLALNHNGTLLVTGGSDGMVRIFDVSGGSPIMGWRAHNEEEGAIHKICLTPDETAVLSLSDAGGVTHWSLHRTGHSLGNYPSVQNSMHPSLCAREWKDLTNAHGDISFIDNKRFLVAHPLYEDILLYDVDSPLKEPPVLKTGHTKGVTCIHSYSNDSCITGSLDLNILDMSNIV